MTEGPNCNRRDNFDIRGQIVTLVGGGGIVTEGSIVTLGDKLSPRGQL